MKLLRRFLGSWYEIAIIRLLAELIFVIIPVAFIIRTFGFGLYQVPTGSMETTMLVGERFFADKLTYWFRSPERGEIIAFDEPNYPYSANKIVNLWQRYVSWNVSNWTKRVIAIPGDHIQGKIEEGKTVVYLNGKKLDETAYLNKYPIIAVYNASAFIHANARSTREWAYKSYDPDKAWDQQLFYHINPNLIIRNSAGAPLSIRYPGTPQDRDLFDIVLGDNQYWVMGDNRLGSQDSRWFGILDGKLIHGKIVFRIWSMDSDESWWIIDLLRNPVAFWKKIRFNRCLQFVR